MNHFWDVGFQVVLTRCYPPVCVQVFAWGCGACLGCGSSEATALRPKLIEELATTRVVDVSIGDSHCLALSHGTPLISVLCGSDRVRPGRVGAAQVLLLTLWLNADSV